MRRLLPLFVALVTCFAAPSARAALANSQASDLVLGQLAFNTAIANNTSANGSSLSNPSGVFIVTNSVTGSSFTFVADYSNHRVLIYKTTSPVNGQVADFVLGQQDMFHGTANYAGITAYTLNGPRYVYSDGVKLYVTDYGNHRVLIWNSIPSTNTVSADVVVGQTTMSAGSAGSDAIGLNNPGQALVIAGKLYVADQSNHRVKIYNTVPAASGASADLVIGQTRLAGCVGHGLHSNCSYYSNNYHNNASSATLWQASNVYISTVEGRTYVSDINNNRVLVYLSTSPTFNTAPSFVLGQPDFEKNECNYGGSPTAQTLCAPRGIWSDGSKLAITDFYNSRVLIWNLPITANQQPADVVVGQANKTSNGGAYSTAGMYYPTGVSYDGPTNQFFVSCWEGSRVLVYNGIPAADGASAIFALGQTGTNGWAGVNQGLSNPTAGTLYDPSAVFVSSGMLYVSDTYNYRVLLYALPITANAQAAVRVLGQPDFVTRTQNNGGMSSTSLGGPTNLYISSGTLFVSDTINHRILVWTSSISYNQQPASFVVGQASMNTSGSNQGGLNASSLNGWWDWPGMGVWASTTTLAVADALNNRVLYFSLPLTGDDPNAYAQLGQPGFNYNDSRSVSNKVLYNPNGLASDGDNLYVADTSNHRVLVFKLPVAGNQPNAAYVLGQSSFTFPVSALAPGSSGANWNGVSGQSMFNPYGVAVSSEGGNFRLYVGDTSNHRVLVWTSSITSLGQSASFSVGQTGLSSNACNNGGVSNTSLCNPQNQLWADATSFWTTDWSNNRALQYKPVPDANYYPATAVLGQDLMTTNGASPGASPFGMNTNWGQERGGSMATDGTRIAMADTNNHRIMIWNTKPTTSGQGADLVLGQPNMSANQVNNGGVNSQSFNTPISVAWDGKQFFVSEWSNQRVKVWNGWPTVQNQPADFVIGQNSFANTGCNAGGLRSGLCTPNGMYSDGNTLWVAEYSNNRVVGYDLPITANQPQAAIELGQPAATAWTTNGADQGGISTATMRQPEGVFYDGERLFVSDTRNHRVLVWNSKPTVNGQSADYVLGQPDGQTNIANNGGPSSTSMYYPVQPLSDGIRLYVPEFHYHVVQMFNSPITAMRQPSDGVLGTRGCGPGAADFCWPTGMTMAGSSLWVTNPWANRVLRFSSTQSSLFNVVITSAMAPATITQGAPAAAFKLLVNAPNPGFPLTWNKLTVYNNGALPANSVQARLFKDTGSGVFEAGTDTPIGALVTLTGNGAAGKAVLNFSQSLDTNYATYFVAVYVNPGSLPYGPSGFPAAGIRVYHNFNSFGFSDPAVEMGGDVPVGVAYNSGSFAPVDAADYVAFSATSTVIPNADHFSAEKAVLMASLTVGTTNDWAFMNTLVVNKTGTSAEGDITGLTLWRDVNGNGAYDGGDVRLSASTVPFGGGQAFLSPSSPLALSTTTIKLLILADFAGSAVNTTFGINVTTESFLLHGVDVASIAASTTPFDSPLVILRPAIPSVQSVGIPTGTWHNSTFTFTGNLGTLGVSYFRHAFDQNTTHAWSDSETQWTGGNSTVTAAAPAQNWWFHARAYNAANQPGGTIDIGPYWLDDVTPAGTNFRHYGSTQGPLGETQWNDLTAAVTAQLTVQDAVSGLNLDIPREFAPNSDTLALWHMNESNGASAADASGNGKTGTVDPSLWTTGKNGSGLAFSGSGVMPLSSPVVLGSSWTIQFWFKAPLPGPGYNGFGYTDKGEAPIMTYTGSRLLGEYPGAATSFNMSTLSNGWHFMSAVGGGGRQRFFIDGAFVGQVSTQAFGSLSTIGGLTTEPWGTMDEVRILRYAAADAQIAKDYALSRGAYVVEYSTNAGYQWNVVDSSFSAPTPYVELAGPHGTTASRTLKVYNLDLAASSSTAVCASVSPCAATNQIRFFPSDLAGNAAPYGPFALRADTPVHAATPTLVSPQNGGFSGQVKPTFFWVRPSTASFPGLSNFYLEVSSYVAMSPLAIFISTPVAAGAVNASYVSTTTLAAGTTYYWRVRAQSFGGVFGPYSPVFTFQTDFATPTASGFVHFSSTAGALADFQFNDLSSGVTAQITVQDALTGLNRAAPPDADTPALWQFEEGLGSVSRNSFNGGNPATFTGGASFGTGQWGKGLLLDGVNDYASVAHAGNINLGGAITVSAWIKPGVTISADTSFVNKGFGNFGWSLEYKSGQLVFAALNGTALTCGTNAACAPATLSAGAWSHLTGTFDNVNTLSLYLNGSLLATIGYGGGVGINSDPLLMGSRQGTSGFFNGVIDDVRLSNYSRTAVQVQADANGATPALAMYSNNAGNTWTVAGATFPVTAGAPYIAVSGANASNGAESYQLRGFGLVQSTSSFTGGLATNQVKFLITDIAGNLLTAGPYGILFDTAAATAISTPSAPGTGLYLSAASPTFYWNTPSIPSVTQYELDVSSDPGFGVLDITITTPAVVGMQVATYTATASLSENTTYYWRVRTRTNLNRTSPWSVPFSFVTDYTSPAASGYLTYGPGGSPLGESAYNSLSSGVTAQISLQDLISGLSGPTARSFQPLARYELEEGFGLAAADSSGNGNGGTLSSSALWNTAGYIGGGLSGTGAYVQITTPAVAGWGGLTVMAWVKPTSASNYQSMWSSKQYQFIANGTGGSVSFYPRVASGGGCVPTTPAAYALNAWHHVAFVADPGAGQNLIYVNGGLAASCAGAGTPIDTSFRLMADGLTGIGGQDSFSGKLDEVTIATSALTAGQIQSNYARTGAFLVLYSTTGGSSWVAANSTSTAAVPRLELSGGVGSAALETLRAVGLNFGQSTNTAVCGGTSPCAATNMIRFLLSDRAGNIRSAGPYAIRVDTTSPVAISTAGAPAAGAWMPGQALTFLWNTPSTGTLAGLRSYTLEASADPAFGSLAVSVSTPQVGGALAAAYVSTFTLTEGATYYWRVRAKNDLGNYSPYSAAATFVVDASSPTAQSFAFFSSTGGLQGESQALDLFSGVTVQLTVQDAVSGLGGAGSYGVSYSTDAGVSWIDFSTYAATTLGQTAVRAMATFGGNLFVGTGPNGEIHRFDGAWSGVLTGTTESDMHSLASFKGKLFAGSAPSGKVFSSVNGTVWDAGTALPGATQVLSLAAFNGKLYAGTTNGGAAGKIFVTSDGVSWSLALSAEAQVYALAAFNGRLYAGTGSSGRVYSTFDGRTWTAVQPDAAQADVRSLAVHNGRLYAGTGSPAAKVYSSADGEAWSPSLTAAGESAVLSLASINGKLYAGTTPNARIHMTGAGGVWAEILKVPGEADVMSLLGYSGKLYAGTGASGKILDITPLTASISGAEGDTGSRVLTGKSLNFVQSTNTAVCAGVYPCGATNQVRFTVSDRAGLVRSAGPFAVLVDTVIANAQPIPGLPDAIGSSGLRPEFVWGVSPAISVANLTHYRVDVSLLPDFSSLEGSTSTLNRYGSLTFNLANATTYYWRVRAFDVLGASSSFSAAQTIRVDVNAPAASAFATIDSTGGVTSETMQLNLAAGVTAQLSVLDADSGIGRDGPAPLAAVADTVLLWHLDAGSGLALADAGRLANAGAAGAGAVWTTGRFGKALRLDGTATANASLAYNASLDVSSATLQAWINSTDGDSGWIINKTGSYGLLLNADGTASAQFEGAALNCAGVKVNDGRWHQLTATFDNGTARIYADGTLCGAGARGAIPAAATGLAAGSQGDGTGPRFSGAVDEVRVLSRALSAAQAAADYATGNPFSALITTTSGAGWTVITSTAPGASPYLTFTGSQYDLAANTLSLRELSLAASTGSQVCGEVAPCGATNQIIFSLADRAGNIRTAGPFAVLVDTFMTRPAAIAPADASWINTTLPQFGWQEAAPAQRHEVYVSTDPSFATLTFSSITAKAYAGSLGALSNAGVYYWKVRAIDSINLVTPFSPTNSFTVDLAVPAGGVFSTISSTAGVIAEAQFNDLAAGVTAQVSVQDLLSGLAAANAGGQPGTGTIGLWRFDAGAGTLAADASSLGGTGVLTGGPVWKAGRFGYAVGTSGGSSVEVPYAAALNTPGAMTVEAWIKTAYVNPGTDASGQGVVTRENGGGFSLNTGRLGFGGAAAFSVGYPTWLVGSTPVNDGQWHHVAATYDGTYSRLYVDGVQDAFAAAPNNLANAISPLSIGRSPNDAGAAGFAGDIDEVHLLNYARTPAQILADYRGYSYTAEVSTDAGGSFALIRSTYAQPAGAPYVALTGAAGSTSVETLQARNLTLAQSTSTATGALATNQVKFTVTDRAGNSKAFGPFGIIVDTVMSQPLPRSPADGAFVTTAAPALTWSERSRVAIHLVQVSTDPVFATLSWSTPTTNSYAAAPVLTENVTYYWRVRSQSAIGVQSPFSPANSFVIDLANPAASLFRTINSTAGVLGEGAINNLASGVTAQIKVQDLVSGLSVAGPGFSVMYSTNAGQTWRDGAWTQMGSPIAGETEIISMAVYNGSLYAGTSGNGKVAVFNGTSWTAMNGDAPIIAGETYVFSLAVHDGKLYAGTYPNAKVAVYDGVSWTATNGGLPVSAGENYVHALASFNGKLYAGTTPSGKVIAFDGATWTPTNSNNPVVPGETQIRSLAEYNGRLYAGTATGGKVSSFDGFNWTATNGGAAVIPGETYAVSLAAYDGKLMAGTYPNGKVAMFDGSSWTATAGPGDQYAVSLAAHAGKLYAGTNPNGLAASFDAVSWTAANGGAAIIAGETGVRSLASYGGRLYAGTAGGGKVARLTPEPAALTGAEGSLAQQTLSATSLSLVQSTNTETCAGVSPCGATNQIKFTLSDRAGLTRTAGPYAIVVDSTAPTIDVTSLTPSSNTIFVTASAADYPAGVRDYNFEASSSSVFAFGISSTNFIGYSTYTFRNLPGGTTYYVRVTARDQVFNTSAPSVVRATTTLGSIFYVGSDVAPASSVQGSLISAVRFTLNTNPLETGSFTSLRVRRTGSGTDADIAAVKIYLDSVADGTFNPGQDTEIGSAVMSGGMALISLGGNAQPVTSTPRTFFVVYQIHAEAVVGDTIGARILSVSDVGVTFPFAAYGSFPSDSGLTAIADGSNTATFTPTDLAPVTASPGASQVAMLKLSAQTNTGSSIMTDMVVYLTGTLASNQVSSVRVYRDANANGVFDSAADDLLTSGADFFVGGVSTLTFTAPQSSRTVTIVPVPLFVVVNVAGSAPIGDTFAVSVATPSQVRVANPGDTVVFTATPMSSSLVTVQTNNTVTVAMGSQGPATYYQGFSYSVVAATMTVDLGLAQIDRFLVNRTGNGVDADVAWVKVYRDLSVDGGALNPAVDLLVGSATFSGGLATVNIATSTVNSGTPAVFFLAYTVDSLANPGNTLGMSLSNVSYVRAVSPLTTVAGAFPFASSTGTIAASINTLLLNVLDQTPGGLLQGATNISLLRVTANAGTNSIPWSGLSVARLGAGLDSDVQSIRIFRDENADGLLQAGTDTLVTSGLDVFGGGVANLAFNTAQIVTTSTRTYFVAVNVNANAAPGNQVGIRLSTTTSFNLNPPNIVSAGPPSFPIDAGPAVINQFPNSVAVTTASLTPAGGANPGTLNVPVMKLTMATDVSTTQLLKLRLDRAGSSLDSDVTAVKVYYDINGLDVFNPGALAQYLLVTSSTLTFGGGGAGSIELGFNPVQGITTAGKTYFVVVDLATGAVPGRTVVVRSLNSGYYTVDAPNTLAPTSFSAAPLSITAPPSSMYVLAYASAPASVTQGASNVVMLSLGLWMKSFTGSLSQLTVTRSGSGLDSDVSRIKIYQDANANGTLEIAFDTQLTSGVFSGATASLAFAAQTLTVSTKTFFVTYDFSTTAQGGDTVGALIGSPGAFTIAAPNGVSSQGIPIQSADTIVVPTMNGITLAAQDKAPAFLRQAATGQHMLDLTMNTTSNAVLVSGVTFKALGTAADADIVRLRVFYDADDNGILNPALDTEVASLGNPFVGGTASVNFTPAQAISAVSRRYMVSVDMKDFADSTKTFGLTVSSATDVAVPSPNYIVDSGFPVNTSIVPILKIPDTLTLTPSSLLAADAIQSTELLALKVLAVSSRARSVWTSWRIGRLGSLADNLIDQVRVYKDSNGSGAWDAGDLLIGTGTFAGGSVTVAFSSAQTVGVSTDTYFVGFKIDINATVGATIGAAIQDNSYFTVSAPDAASGAGLPFLTPLVSVMDAKTPTQPVVVMPDGPFSSSFESIRFAWTSSVVLGSLTTAYYCIGTTPGGTQVRGWQGMIPVPSTVTIPGLLLASGSTYYVSVKVGSSFGFTSAAGLSAAQLVDAAVPAKMGAGTALVGDKSVVLNWSPVPAGPSGIAGYLVEFRRGDSPLWRNAKTYATASLSVAATTVSASALVTSLPYAATTVPQGTLYFRASAVTGAGVPGDPSDPMRVQFGGLPVSGLAEATAYPNPFDSRKGPVNLTFVLASASEVKIEIYSIYGAKVREISFPGGVTGSNTTTWDGTDSSGTKVSKGIYIAVLSADGTKSTIKIGVIH